MFSKSLFPIVLLLLLSPLALTQVPAELEAEQAIAEHQAFRHHLILLIDRSGSVRKQLSKPKYRDRLKRMLTSELPELLFTPGEVLPNRALLEEQDYLSTAFFGLGGWNRYDYRSFIGQGSDLYRTDPIGQNYVEGIDTTFFIQLHKDIQSDTRSLFAGNFTGLSFAGPIGFNYFKQSKIKVHRTFVLLISDGEYHSIDDPSSELSIPAVEDSWGKMHTLNNSEYIDSIYATVKTNYLWHPALKEINAQPFYMNLYEYKPSQRNLSIRSKLDFPAEVRIERRPEGFEQTIRIKDGDLSDPYTPRKFLLQVRQANSEQIIHQEVQEFESGLIDLTLHDDILGRSDAPLELDLRFWLNFKDPAYGAHQLHPFGSVEQGAEGLVETIRINKEARANILGIVPLFDGLYRFSAPWAGPAQRDNVRFWNSTLIVLAFLLLLLVVYRYIRRNREITDPKLIRIQTAKGSKID
ncbi:MAG: hypothetical protein AAGG75_04180 [Bacteroidota bacterium]